MRTLIKEESHQQISSGKYLNLFISPFGYEYVHDRTGRLVAVLPFRIRPDGDLDFVGRWEPRSCWGDGMEVAFLSSITGGIEEGEAPLNAAVRELAEEGGVEVSPKEMIFLGTSRNAKALDTEVFLYAVNLGEKEIQDNGPGDGTDGEKNSWNEWVNFETILEKAPDPLLSVMLLKLLMVDFGNGLRLSLKYDGEEMK